MSDRLVLAVGLLLLYLPGLLLLVVCRVRSPLAWAGVAPAATLGLLQVAALTGSAVGLRLWPATLVLLAALAGAALVLELRAHATAVLPDVARSSLAAARARPAVAAVGVLGVATACWLATTTWLRGFAGLATPPQEHDTVQHLLLTAFIARTGQASPFDVMPLDLASGTNPRFYPAGVHTFAGLLGGVAPDPVVAFNATTTLVLGVAAPVAVFAAAAAVAGRRDGVVAGALAAVFASLLYRPWFQLAHDGGIVAFAVGLGLAPATATCVLALRRRSPGTAVVTALVALALFAVHPSIAVFLAGTAAVAGAVALLLPAGRRWVAEQRWVLLGTAGLCALAVAPWALVSAGVGDQVSSYPETPATEPFGVVALRLLRFTYSGFRDPTQTEHQTAFAVLFAVGALGCLTARRLLPLLAAWAAWALEAVLFNAGWYDAPVVGHVGSVFYNSLTRIVDLSWVLAPAVAGAGIAVLLRRAVALAGRLLPRGDGAARTGPGGTDPGGTVPGGTDPGRTVPGRTAPGRVAVPAVAAAGVVLYLLTSGLHYRAVNTDAVGDRYGHPGFVRVSAQDRAAFDWLGEQDGVGRVMNNGNDGSTYLYVYEGIPVVNVFPLGVAESRYGIYLLEHLDEMDTDAKARCLVQRYDITHVFVSRSSPPVGAHAAPFGWVDTPDFSAAPGLADLARTEGTRLVYRNGDASVYAVEESVLDGEDRQACSADPAAP